MQVVTKSMWVVPESRANGPFCRWGFRSLLEGFRRGDGVKTVQVLGQSQKLRTRNLCRVLVTCERNRCPGGQGSWRAWSPGSLAVRVVPFLRPLCKHLALSLAE